MSNYYCHVYPLDTLKTYKYVVVLSRYQGKYLLSRHKKRTTWETQGGHIEPGETPLQAAKREILRNPGHCGIKSSLCLIIGPEILGENPTAWYFWRKSKSWGRSPKVKWQK